MDLIHRQIFGNLFEEFEEENQISDEDLQRIEIKEKLVEVEKIQKEYKKFSTLIPVCDFNWESEHTSVSDAGYATILAKEIAFDLELTGQPQTFDLFTRNGTKATFNVSDHSTDYNNNQSMFFIREDLLKKYLKQKDCSLIWAVWGEREYSSTQARKLFSGEEHPEQTHTVFSLVKRYNNR